jgi:centriolar protein POC1
MDEPIIEKTLRGHKDAVTSISFNPSSKLSHRKQVPANEQLASASLDGTLTLWTWTRCPNDCCNDLKKGLNHSSPKLSSCKEDVRAFRFAGHTGPIHHVSYSPSGQLLASCSSDTTVRIWTPNVNGKCIILKGHQAPVRSMDFSKSESLMVTCSDDKTLKIWSLPQCTFQKSLLGHTHWVRACRLSQDPNLCASGSDDGTVRLWDIEHGENVVTYTVERICGTQGRTTSLPTVTGVEFHPSNYILGTTSTDGYVRLYDLRRDKVIQVLSASGPLSSSKEISANYGVPSISFDPNGNSLLMSSRNHHPNETSLFSLWDMRNQRILYSVNHKEGDKDRENTTTVPVPVTFSPDGSRFSSGCADGAVLIWKNSKDTSSNTKTITQSTLPSDSAKSNGRRADDKDSNRSHSTLGKSSFCEFVVEDLSPDGMNRKNQLSLSESEPNVPSQNGEISDSHNKIQTYEPALLARTLEHIVGQLTLITQTMELIDRRVTILEDTLTKVQSLKDDQDKT